MALTLTAKSRLWWIGDSVSGPFSTATGVCIPIFQGLRGRFGGPAVPQASSPFVPPAFKWPVIGGCDGVAGRECFTLGQTAPTFATFAALVNGPFTHAVVQLGINDAAQVHAAARTLPQVLAAHLVILDGINSIYGIPYANIMTIGPWQRPADLSVEVPQIVTQFQTNIALRGGTFVDWSGISSAGGNSIGDQTHASATGAALLAAPVLAAMLTA